MASRVNFNIPQIQRSSRRVPVEQIIAIQGHNPVAAGIDTAGQALSAALMKRAELKRQMGEKAADRDLVIQKMAQDKMLAENKEANMQRYREGMLGVAQSRAANTGMGRPLPQDTVRALTQADTAISQLQKADLQYKPSFTGPVQGWVANSPLRKVPFIGDAIANPERSIFHQNIGLAVKKFLYSEAGKQLSDAERMSMEQFLAQPNIPDIEFRAQLKNMVGIMKEANMRLRSNLTQTGYRVPGQMPMFYGGGGDELAAMGLVEE